MRLTAKEYLDIFEVAIGKTVAINFLYFVAAIGIGLALDFGNVTGDRVFKTSYTALALALLVFAISHLWFGIVKQFGFESIIKVAVSLFVGSVAIGAVLNDSNHVFYLLTGSGIYLFTCMATIGWYVYQIKKERDKPLPHEVSDDPSVKGKASIFRTGSDSYKLVKRHNLNVKSPAKDFEYRLIRYIERSLNVKAYSMSGDGCDYWALQRMPVEIMVIGPNRYNTRTKIKDTEWILRMRETDPLVVTEWIAKHFEEARSISRPALHGSIQTQFNAKHAGDLNTFFKKGIPFSVEEASDVPVQSTDRVLH